MAPEESALVFQKGISKKGQREKSPSPEKLTVLLQARTVRVGTFRGAPIEPIQLSDEGIEFYIEGIYYRIFEVLSLDQRHKLKIYKVNFDINEHCKNSKC